MVPSAKKGSDCFSPANFSGRADRIQSILAFNMDHNIRSSADTLFEILLTKLNNLWVEVVFSRSRCHLIGRAGAAVCKRRHSALNAFNYSKRL